MEQSAIIIEKITSFTPSIAAAIKRLAAAEGNNYKPLTDNDLQEMLTSTSTTILIAKDTDTQEVVGMITVLVYRIPYVKKAYLDDLSVDEAFRGRGIGSQLMKEALALAKQKGAAYIDLTARPRRAESNGLYEKLGFKKRDTNVYRFLYDYGEV